MRQLTALDAQFLAMESGRTYGHVGGLAIYDPSTAPGGEVTRDDLVRMVSERLHLLPPFKWKLVNVPFGLDHPYWIEDPDFDLDYHIRESAIPPPGDDAKLADTVARIFARPLDRNRPLWTLYLIHGLPDGKIAMLTKVHHAAVDGMSGAEIMGVLFDLTPEGQAIPQPERTSAQEQQPSQLEMLGRGLAAMPLQPLRAVRSLPTTVPALTKFPGVGLVPGAPALTRAVGRLRRTDGGLIALRTRRAPKLSFNGLMSPHRRFAFGSLELDKVKALKNELGIKVNDVVVALCATGLRDWLEARGELPDEPLTALVPVSVRTAEEKGTYGNRVSGMIVPIPTNIADPRERLMQAHQWMNLAKKDQQGLPASLMTDASNFIPPALHSRGARVAMEVMGRLRPPLNVVISNVPGPAIDLYCAGAQLQANYPVSVVTDGVGLNITVMSYKDKIDFGIIGDGDSTGDLWPLMDSMRAGLDELCEVICGAPARPRAATGSRGGKRPRPKTSAPS
jgi:WS/DGAT/MGAT family acyltransferase